MWGVSFVFDTSSCSEIWLYAAFTFMAVLFNMRKLYSVRQSLNYSLYHFLIREPDFLPPWRSEKGTHLASTGGQYTRIQRQCGAIKELYKASPRNGGRFFLVFFSSFFFFFQTMTSLFHRIQGRPGLFPGLAGASLELPGLANR